MKKYFAPLAALFLNFAIQGQIAPAGAAPHLMSGQCTADNTHLLTSQINWYHSLQQAESVAQNQGKMIFYMHMLGDLGGAT